MFRIITGFLNQQDKVSPKYSQNCRRMPRLVGKNRPQGEQAQCGVTTGFESGACF